MNCKDTSKLLTAYLDGEVMPEEQEQIQAHLSTCPHCREELEALAATQDNLRQALRVTAAGATPSPQAWAGIRQRLAEERPRVTTLGLAKSRLRGGRAIVVGSLVSRQPVWKTAVVGVLAVALICGLGLGMLSLGGESAYAEAADIARNSLRVQAALGGEVEVLEVVRIADNEGTVLCAGEAGGLVAVRVDLVEREVTEVIPMPTLTNAEKEEAVSIVRADPGVQELLDEGAIIECATVYSFDMIVTNGDVDELSATMAPVVAIELEGTTWIAAVDLSQGEVVTITLQEIAITPVEVAPVPLEKLVK